jgi:hypothetical protein
MAQDAGGRNLDAEGHRPPPCGTPA